MKKSVLMMVLFPLPSFAKIASTPGQLSEYHITVTSQELDLIGLGLGEQPFNKAAPLLNKLRQQVTEQQQAAAQIVKPVEEKKE